MAGDWYQTTLDQLGRIVTGKTPRSRRPEYFGGEIPFVTPTDFDGSRRIETTHRCLTERGASAVRGALIPREAIMVSCIGSDMGKSAIADAACVTNQQINSVVVESPNCPLFVYYNLSIRKEEIRAASGGSAQPILNKSTFGQLDILLPPILEQRAIAPHPRHARRQDRAEPAHERDAGDDGAGVVQGLVRGFRPHPRQS